MNRWMSQKGGLARSAAIGLGAGLVVGLVEILILKVIDLARFSPSRLPLILATYGLLGLLGGLAWGLVRRRWAPPERTPPVRQVVEEGKSGRTHLKQNLLLGLGAGLVGGSIVSLVEIVGLLLVDRSWQPLDGLLYATVAYGLLGLLGGLALGLLRGLWCAWRAGDACAANGAAWAMFATGIASVGTFLVVHNRVRRDLLHVSSRGMSLMETLLVDSLLLAVAALLAAGLWFLLRRLAQGARLVQFRWSLGLYVMMVLVAIPTSNPAGLSAILPSLAASTHSSPPPDLRDRPNVIFIVAETLRADRVGSYGHDGHLTPHIDALARKGVLYRHMGVQAPGTKPSVATMLTSLYSTSHTANLKESILPDSAITLPEVLSFAGYHTAGFTTNVNTSSEFNFQQGYDEYEHLKRDPPQLPFAPRTAMRFAVYRVLRRLPWNIYSLTTGIHGPTYREAASVNRVVLSWLKANKDSRFFLFLHYFDPHIPYYAHPYDGTKVARKDDINPDPAQAPYMSQLYEGEIAYLDGHLGVLFDELKAMGVYDDTLIVFVGDHGEEFYEHGGWWHGDTLYEEQLAVPLIVKYPGNAHAGTVDEELARGLDLAPTVLDIVGLPIPDTMQGVSLRPGAAASRAEFIFAEEIDDGGQIRSLRTHQDKLVVVEGRYHRSLPPVALFDLEQDPGEQKSLAQEEPDRVRALRAELDRLTAFAEAHALAAQSGELDDATQEILRQIGY